MSRIVLVSSSPCSSSYFDLYVNEKRNIQYALMVSAIQLSTKQNYYYYNEKVVRKLS
jgi:hypothetical protein